MKTNPAKVIGACAILLLALHTATAAPIPLAPGGATALGATPVGGIQVANLVSPFNDNNGKFSGVLTTSVFANDPNNVFGGLTFQYKVFNNVNSIDGLERLTIIGWAASPVAAVDNVLGGGILSASANRTPLPGDTIGFSWVNLMNFSMIIPGGTGTVLVQTPLNVWGPSVANILDGGIATAPTLTPIPEPVGLFAIVLGFGLLCLRGRSRD